MMMRGKLRSRNRGLRMLLVTAALAMGLAPAVGPVAAQGDDVPRAWDGRPDLNGIWQAIGTAHWNLEDHPSLNIGPSIASGCQVSARNIIRRKGSALLAIMISGRSGTWKKNQCQ